MKKFTLNPVKLWKRHITKNPWFEFNTDGIVDEDGRVKVEMDWNKAFVVGLRNLGFSGHNEEEVVEKYLTILLSRAPDVDPYMPAGQEEPFSEAHPALGSDQNKLMQ